eukprot:3920655-Karenia_brevis.AAC.1
MIKQKFDWVHQNAKTFTGIGGCKVKTFGKRRMPVALKLRESQQIIPGFLESHEQEGARPLLLSDQAQAQLGFVKDMRDGQ